MRDQLIIRLTDSAPARVSWVKVSSDATENSVEVGELAEAVSQSVGAQVVVLIPASDVWQGQVKVPTKNKQRMLKAIPYMVEELLASDVEELHFSVGKVDAEGQVSIIAITRQLMNKWTQMLSEAGISADMMLPELVAVPTENASLSILLDDLSALSRGDGFVGCLVDIDNLEVVLSRVMLEPRETPFSRIHVWHDDAQNLDLFSNTLGDDVEVNYSSLSNGLLSLVPREGLVVTDAINLLQGDYSRREQMGKLWRPWRYAASLLALLFVLQLGLAVSESSKLEAEYVALKAEAETIYRKTFPDAKRIVNVKAQMQQKLAALKTTSPIKKANFLTLLSDSGMVFKQTSGLVLRSVRYKNGMLDVELEVPSLQVLDQLKQRLQGKQGLKAEIQSAASRKNIVQGRLQIKGAV